MDPPSTTVPLIRRLTYGVGHVFNDMCAAMWFSYLLLYLESVNKFSNYLAGLLLLLGQIADAVATPLIGYESDRTEGCGRYGRRKSWHLLGTVCVGVSFPFIFITCITCTHASDWAKFIYYAPFVVIFQFGWASTQISHLALIPEISSDTSIRVELNAIRYGFTVLSSLLVYGLTYLILSTDTNPTSHKFSPSNAPQFRDLVLIVVGVGVLFSVIFHIGTREPPRIVSDNRADISSANCCYRYRNDSARSKLWKDWLKDVRFYLMAALYMCTRLVVNLTQIYLPMYAVHSLSLPRESVALMPLVVFISGFVVSFLMKPLNFFIGQKGSYFVGLVFVGGACVWFWLLPASHQVQALGSAVILGCGTTTILVTSLAMTADLIDDNVSSSAFVYGAMSFTDKLSNGVVVMVIQQLHPCNKALEACCPACVWYYRDVMVLIPGGVAAAALVILIVLGTLNSRRPENRQEVSQEDPDETQTLIRSRSSPVYTECEAVVQA